MRLQLDEGAFCALIGYRFSFPRDDGSRTVPRPFQAHQVIHVSATEALSTENHPGKAILRDALSSKIRSNQCRVQKPHGSSNNGAKAQTKMTENNATPKSAGTGDAAAGIPFYEKQRQHLKDLIAKRRALEKRIVRTLRRLWSPNLSLNTCADTIWGKAAQEDAIYQKETEYLENTPAGNIITGFDNYTKGTGTAAAARRKTGLTEANRVFSRSSISYNANSVCSPPSNTPLRRCVLLLCWV